MGGEGGQEIESRTAGSASEIPAGAAIVAFEIIGDLTVLGVVVQSIQSDGRVDAIPGQAFSTLMILRRDAVALKYGEAGMFPSEQDIYQPRTDLFTSQEGLEELVAKQQHDLDRIGPGDWEEVSIGGDEPVGHETVKVGMKAGRIIAVGLD